MALNALRDRASSVEQSDAASPPLVDAAPRHRRAALESNRRAEQDAARRVIAMTNLLLALAIVGLLVGIGLIVLAA